MRTARIMSAACAALALGGCATLAPEPDHDFRFSGQPSPAEQALLKERPLKLGIALSGGGLRAALYSAGALRALYENKILQKANVLSTVSGGGYTGYWVYTGQIAEDERVGKRDFGSARFEDAVFPQSLCERVGDANFVTFPAMVGNAFIGRARHLYERRIGETFGREDRDLTFKQLGDKVSAGYPHLIVNATVLKPKPKGWRDGLYEMTPAGATWGARISPAGADAPEMPWSDGWDVSYRRAVAASGAAVTNLLYRHVDEPPGFTPSKVALHDGGKSENLGAIALIRRGVPTIVIIDAEHDPTYNFGAYRNLKRRLNVWGGDIQIPGIETFLVTRTGRDNPPQSYFVGNAKLARADGQIQTSAIHYVKMSMPSDFGKQLDDQWGDMIDRDEPHPEVEAFNDAMAENYSNGSYDCSKLANGPVPGDSFFGYVVHRYGNWWNGTRRARYSSSDAAMNFPQYTTFDQSMYRDQAKAFIGLGYLQAKALRLD